MKVLEGLLERRLEQVKDKFVLLIDDKMTADSFEARYAEGKVYIKGNNIISVAHGIYVYLKQICKVNWSWCGNTDIKLNDIVEFDGVINKVINQKYRVYMNYCTVGYSMCWWNWERWEKELDFMAMNGINMPLAVIGSEAVWYETLLLYGFSENEALSTISGMAFWPWQLMTNIEGYMPPKSKKYVYERLELGKKILNRMLEYGMYPLQQGFSGHVPMLLKNKFPNAKIIDKNGWCLFPKTAQLDPLDPLFQKIGRTYLDKEKELLGTYHFYACDPFHENAPPKPWSWYLKSVGRAIDKMYKDFDSESVWVMQSWSLRKHIAKSVPKDRLLILDINSAKALKTRNLWNYPIIAGQLHNFGGKNAMQGKLQKGCRNPYAILKARGANLVGSGMFMEGIEQNPIVYDMQFELCTTDKALDFDKWLENYIERRYGIINKDIKKVWDILLKTCYKNDSYADESMIGSTLCARPSLLPEKGGPCDIAAVFYKNSDFVMALRELYKLSDILSESDGYQFDLCDITRQWLSNMFYENQVQFAEAYKNNDLNQVKVLSEKAKSILIDMDNLLGYREEFSLNRWINDSHNLATDEEEKLYYDEMARTLVTLWGDVNGDTALFDYAWKEWHGLIKEYYLPRWSKYYDYVIECMEQKREVIDESGSSFFGRTRMYATEFGKNLAVFEKNWCKTYSEYPVIKNKNIIPIVEKLLKKWDN